MTCGIDMSRIRRSLADLKSGEERKMHMKKTSISIDMETEKLRALRFYLEKKETTLETELEDFLAKLYEKYVPAQTREYIESLEDPAEAPRSRVRRQPRTLSDAPSSGIEEAV